MDKICKAGRTRSCSKDIKQKKLTFLWRYAHRRHTSILILHPDNQSLVIMGIQSLEIKFSKIGVNQLSFIRAKFKKVLPTFLLPLFCLRVNQRRRSISLVFISDKKSIKQVIAGDTFICLQINDEYKVHNLDGDFQGSVSAEEYGNLLQVNEDSFILLKGSAITLINDKGEVAGSRMLTEEELRTINES